KLRYTCRECGFDSPKWLGQCPQCNAWNAFEESVPDSQTAHRARLDPSTSTKKSTVLRLNDIPATQEDRFSTGLKEFDRALGGGLVQGSLVLLGGDPGIGKSTLMLQMAGRSQRQKLLYVSGEESASQLRARAQRLGITN
ncbi:ATPase domain-containing protein, partial [Arthrospira platensis SPKY1]|nr:ATPase domain-containing protein [Arthrospira platensis SPKY1]